MTWEEMREYLRHLWSYYGSYHNHKETSAWAAVVVFTIISLQLPTVISKEMLLIKGLKIFCTFSVIIFLVAVWIFIMKQLDLRKRSSEILSACALIETENIQKPSGYPVEDSYKTDPRGIGEYQWDHVLPGFIMDKADSLKNSGGKAGKTLDLIKYFLLIMATGVSLVRIWWPL